MLTTTTATMARKHHYKPQVWTHLDDLKLAQYERLDNDFNCEVFYAYQEKCISNWGQFIEEQECVIERERFACNQHRSKKTYSAAVKEGEETIYFIYGPKKEIVITKNGFCFQMFKEYYPLDIKLKKLDKIYGNIIKKSMEGLSKSKFDMIKWFILPCSPSYFVKENDATVGECLPTVFLALHLKAKYDAGVYYV